MDSFVKLLNNFFLEISENLDEKNTGVNYLEKIKFLLVEKLNNLDKKIIENLIYEIQNKKIFSKIIDFKKNSLSCTIDYSEESISKIKNKLKEELLSIVIQGMKTITIFDNNNQNRSFQTILSKNMAIVLCKDTIITENINKNSIILNIKSN